MFLFRRKKVTVDCFINNESIYNLCKIDHANKFIPQEWKQLPAFVDIKSNNDPRSDMKLPVATAKRCISLTNLFNTGFILPSWTDFDIEVLDDGTVHRQSPMNDLNAEPHPRFLIWDNLYKNYSHTKIYSPWLIREKSGIKFSWNQCDWHNTNRIADCHILSGLIDFKAQHGSHINMFVKKGTQVHFEAGEPMVHIIPLTEKELDLKCHLIDNNEYTKIYSAYTYRLKYNGNHRLLLNNEKKLKCPFGFSK